MNIFLVTDKKTMKVVFSGISIKNYFTSDNGEIKSLYWTISRLSNDFVYEDDNYIYERRKITRSRKKTKQ